MSYMYCRVQMIMQELGKMEDGIFKDRQQREIRFKAQNKAKRRRERMETERKGPAFLPQVCSVMQVKFSQWAWLFLL